MALVADVATAVDVGATVGVGAEVGTGVGVALFEQALKTTATATAAIPRRIGALICLLLSACLLEAGSMDCLAW